MDVLLLAIGRQTRALLLVFFIRSLLDMAFACLYGHRGAAARHWQKELRQHTLPSLFDLHKESALITIDVFTAGSVSFLLCCCEGRTRGSDCMGH
jgi:hypothetical protein